MASAKSVLGGARNDKGMGTEPQTNYRDRSHVHRGCTGSKPVVAVWVSAVSPYLFPANS